MCFACNRCKDPGLTRLSQPRVNRQVVEIPSLEGEADAELTPERVRNDGAGRVDEALGMAEVRRIGNASGAIDAKVVAVVGPIGQVERLREQLQVHAIAELDILCEAHVEFEEWIPAQWIVLRNRAPLRDPVQPIEAVLRSRVVA